MGFVCPRCQKEFGHKSHFREHIESVHEKKRHKCDQCEEDFGSRRGLRYHELTKHEGKKIERNKKQCPHCNKSFSTANYNTHLLTHQSLKPFLCPFCSSYAAKRLGNLKQHIDSLHFKCRWFCLMDGCNESATRDGYLQVHLKKKHNISSKFADHMVQRRSAATPSSLTPVRGKLPSSTVNNDPREASTSMRQQAVPQSFTVKFADIDTYPKLHSLVKRLELIATSASSDSSSSDDSSDESTDESDASNDKSDENQETMESESEDSALYLVEEEMNKRRRLTWHNPNAASSSDDDDDDNDNNDDNKQSNSKSSSSSSSFSFTSKPKQEPKEEDDEASSSSSGPPPRRIDVKPRNTVWIPTGERIQQGTVVNQLQREPSDALEPYNNWLRNREQQEQKEQNEDHD